MADHDDDDLTERFRSLEGVPVPPWRDRVSARAAGEVDLDPAVDGARRWPGALVLAGVAAAALLIGVLAWPSDDDGPLVAGPAAAFGELPPTSDQLMCPPALLDVGDLFEQVAPEVVSASSVPGGPTPYVLRWEQEGREVTLSYPAPQIRTADLPPSEQVSVGDGRVARLEYRTRLTADVITPTASGVLEECDGFWLSVAGDGSQLAPPVTGGDPPGKGPSEGTMPAPVDPRLLDECSARDDETRTSSAAGGDTATSAPPPTVPAATQPIRDLTLRIAERVQLRPPGGSVEVPDLVGLDGIAAQDRLARTGLIPDGAFPIISSHDSRAVASTSPAAGSVVPVGARVCVLLEPLTPTTTAPADPVEDVVLPLPSEPMVCPFGRVQVSGGVYSEPGVHSHQTLEWLGPEQTEVQLSWPSRAHVDEGHRSRPLEVKGRPALMHDGGDGQNLVYDTGLPDGPCRWIEVGVYGGSSIPRREELAIELAAGFIAIDPPPSAEPPNVVGRSLPDAADQLARAGFVPDWGHRPAIGDEPTAVPAGTVVSQQPPDEDGVVRLGV